MEKARFYRARNCYVHRKVAGNEVLISVGAGVADFNGYINLNATAAFLWEKLQSPCTAEFLIKEILGEFEVSEEEARQDVQAFLLYLQNHSMVEVSEHAET